MIPVIIIFIILVILISIANTKKKFKKENYVCSSCGFVGSPEIKYKGSIWIEIILWLFFLIPGIIYSIWRVGSKFLRCPMCNGITIIPVNTPVGQKLSKDLKKDDRR
jgi:hypothetical protein